MQEEKGTVQTVAGARQTLRLISSGQARLVLVAKDAPERMTAPVLSAAQKAGVPIEVCESMAALGRRCRIAVKSSVAAELK